MAISQLLAQNTCWKAWEEADSKRTLCFANIEAANEAAGKQFDDDAQPESRNPKLAM